VSNLSLLERFEGPLDSICSVKLTGQGRVQIDHWDNLGRRQTLFSPQLFPTIKKFQETFAQDVHPSSQYHEIGL